MSEPRPPITVVAISDTHERHEELDLPPGDVLVHAGDFTSVGTVDEVRDFLDWFGRQPHRHKVLIAGNHDFLFERQPDEARKLVPPGVTYLEDSTVEILGRRFYGAPWTPEFLKWAFMLPRGEALRAKWDRIPDGIDVLVTHGPPYGHGDVARPLGGKGHPHSVGCHELLLAVRRVKPRLHIYGHVHAGHGIGSSDEVRSTVFANAATCDEGYKAVHAPLVIEVA